MSASKRANVITHAHKILAKHYKPIKPVERPILEELLYACCLEDSRADVADECFGRLQESFFDWNEVRVTTIHELAEVLRGVSDPTRAANLIKHTLHSVFEAIYAFDLEPLRKLNLGVAVKQLQGYRGTTPFSISYTVQRALGGHSIPVSVAGMTIMQILGIVTDKNASQGVVPGLERAITKTKGIEFGSLLQQFAADYAASPFNTNVRAILVEIEPDAKSRLPKRGGRKVAEKTTKPNAKANAKATTKAAPAKTVKAPAKGTKKPKSKKQVVKKKTAAPARPKKKTTKRNATKSIAKKAAPTGKKSTSKQLARRKPR